MERIRNAIKQWRSSLAYEPLDDGTETPENRQRKHTQRFSWMEYAIFLLLGISMLWAWYIPPTYTLHTPFSYLQRDCSLTISTGTCSSPPPPTSSTASAPRPPSSPPSPPPSSPSPASQTSSPCSSSPTSNPGPTTPTASSSPSSSTS